MISISAPRNFFNGPHVNRRGGVMHAGLNAVAPDLQLGPRATDHCVLLGSLCHPVVVDPPSETIRDISVSVCGGELNEGGEATDTNPAVRTLVSTRTDGYSLNPSDSEGQSQRPARRHLHD